MMLTTLGDQGFIGTIFSDLEDAEREAGLNGIVLWWRGFANGLDAGYVIVDKIDDQRIDAFPGLSRVER